MKNYNIEGGIDFYSELYKSLDDEENGHKTEEDDMLCLITNKPLTELYFKMDCGHKFNYVPLFLDIKNHKKKFNGMESTSGQLKQDEIRCPYCRKKQKGVLPYYEELMPEKIIGVNDVSIYIKKHESVTCQFLTLNPSFEQDTDTDTNTDTNSNNNNTNTDTNTNTNNTDTNKDKNGNPKYVKCLFYGYKLNSTDLIGHYKSNNTIIDYPVADITDNNHYCWSHKKQMIKKYKTEMLQKIKDDIKNKKNQDKENIKKLKEEEKQKEKETKQKEKEKLQKELKKLVASSKKNEETVTDTENVVIGLVDLHDNISQNMYCLEILKTGAKKGECCGCKIFTDKLCKRHYKLKK